MIWSVDDATRSDMEQEEIRKHKHQLWDWGLNKWREGAEWGGGVLRGKTRSSLRLNNSEIHGQAR